ncbi:hypothetical protein D3C80_997300 [compost metagenome]
MIWIEACCDSIPITLQETSGCYWAQEVSKVQVGIGRCTPQRLSQNLVVTLQELSTHQTVDPWVLPQVAVLVVWRDTVFGSMVFKHAVPSLVDELEPTCSRRRPGFHRVVKVGFHRSKCSEQLSVNPSHGLNGTQGLHSCFTRLVRLWQRDGVPCTTVTLSE